MYITRDISEFSGSLQSRIARSKHFKNAIKTTLFVASILLLGGALAAHYLSWGMPAEICFSMFSVGTLISFVCFSVLSNRFERRLKQLDFGTLCKILLNKENSIDEKEALLNEIRTRLGHDSVEDICKQISDSYLDDEDLKSIFVALIDTIAPDQYDSYFEILQREVIKLPITTEANEDYLGIHQRSLLSMENGACWLVEEKAYLNFDALIESLSPLVSAAGENNDKRERLAEVIRMKFETKEERTPGLEWKILQQLNLPTPKGKAANPSIDNFKGH